MSNTAQWLSIATAFAASVGLDENSIPHGSRNKPHRTLNFIKSTPVSETSNVDSVPPVKPKKHNKKRRGY